MNDVLWIISAIVLLLALFVLTAAGFYRAGYTNGYLASGPIVLKMNENYMKMAATAMEYERELKELKESYRYSQPPGVK